MATREAFQNSGVYHVLVVSGLHVAWIAGVLLYLLELCRIPRELSRLAVALVILLYTCVVGFQASITRCLWMFTLYLAGQTLFRRASPVNILMAAGACLLVARPNWLFDAGFQLSFLSVLAIGLTALPIITERLKPLTVPVQFAGKPDRLFLQPGTWQRRGRWIRTRVELFVEACTDRRHYVLSRLLLIIARISGAGAFTVGSLILVSLSVQLWLEPVLAYSFNRLSWIAPVANLVVVPLSSLVLTAGIASALAPSLWSIADSFSWLASRLAGLMLTVTKFIAAVPHAWQRCPTPSAPWIAGGLLLLFVWSFMRWRMAWFPCLYIGAVLACLSSGGVPGFDGRALPFGVGGRNTSGDLDPEKPLLSLTFLDVGEGDSMVIEFPDRRVWVLDAGGIRQSFTSEDSAYAFDVGEAVVSRYLWCAWITRLDRLLLSHPDLDHAGGIQALMKNFDVTRFEYSEFPGDSILARILALAQERHIPAEPIHAGNSQIVGAVVIRTLNPPNDGRLRTTNESSIVLHVMLKRFSALLTGDLEKGSEAELVSGEQNARSLLLKVAHHGSRSATRAPFLDQIRPRWAIISVGKNNPFGHPSPEVLSRLLRHRVRTLQTLDEGAITFKTDGRSYVLQSYASGLLEEGLLTEDLLGR